MSDFSTSDFSTSDFSTSDFSVSDLSSSPIAISAVICTHNRDRYLGPAIDSLLAQDLPDTFEVIVIDNASTDTTRQIVEARLGDRRLKYVYESTLGLSTARNRGVQESSGEIIAYLDDDAVAEPCWLRELLSAYANNDRLGVAGGRVTLLWPDDIEPPAWISADMMGCLGAYDLGMEVVNITEPGLTPRGLNYSLRRSFLEQIGGFDAQLGRVGKKLLSNEELVMTELALAQGWQVQYLPNALVAHNVAEERLQRDWFLRRSWWQGVSEFYRDQLSGRAWAARVAASGERLVRGLYKSVKYLFKPAACFDNLTYAYGQIGYMSTAIHSIWKGESQA